MNFNEMSFNAWRNAETYKETEKVLTVYLGSYLTKNSNFRAYFKGLKKAKLQQLFGAVVVALNPGCRWLMGPGYYYCAKVV